jgi:hypothetical protein
VFDSAYLSNKYEFSIVRAFHLETMHSEVFGFRVNLTYIAVLVAFYDLGHILYELKERFDLFWVYEDYEDGCLSDLFQTHCKFIYTEVAIYVLDFIFTGFLIYGSSSVRIFENL